MTLPEYNTKQKTLVMSEYGRTVQKLVEECLEITDKEERYRCAETIVGTMASICQERLSNPDVQQKLWNHLALISDFKLDIDYPVEIIRPEEAHEHPKSMDTRQNKIKHRHYGHIIECALEQLSKMEPGEERDCLVCNTADQMRQSLFTWNPDIMSEEKVMQDIDEYTGQHLSQALEGHVWPALQSLPTSIRKKRK